MSTATPFGSAAQQATDPACVVTPNPTHSVAWGRRAGLGASILHRVSRWRQLGAVLRCAGAVHRAKPPTKQDFDEFATENLEAFAAAQAGGEVLLEAADETELQSSNWASQGDASHYTEDALRERHALRSAASVIASVEAWWAFIPKGSCPSNAASARTVSKPAYCAMVVLIQLVLLPRFGMEAEEDYDPEEDWAEDAKGAGAMGFPAFFDALFVLTDLWSDGVSADAYARLLSTLLSDAMDNGRLGTLLERFGWVDEPAEPAEAGRLSQASLSVPPQPPLPPKLLPPQTPLPQTPLLPQTPQSPKSLPPQPPLPQPPLPPKSLPPQPPLPQPPLAAKALPQPPLSSQPPLSPKLPLTQPPLPPKSLPPQPPLPPKSLPHPPHPEAAFPSPRTPESSRSEMATQRLHAAASEDLAWAGTALRAMSLSSWDGNAGAVMPMPEVPAPGKLAVFLMPPSAAPPPRVSAVGVAVAPAKPVRRSHLQSAADDSLHHGMLNIALECTAVAGPVTWGDERILQLWSKGQSQSAASAASTAARPSLSAPLSTPEASSLGRRRTDGDRQPWEEEEDDEDAAVLERLAHAGGAGTSARAQDSSRARDSPHARNSPRARDSPRAGATAQPPGGGSGSERGAADVPGGDLRCGVSDPALTSSRQQQSVADGARGPTAGRPVTPSATSIYAVLQERRDAARSASASAAAAGYGYAMQGGLNKTVLSADCRGRTPYPLSVRYTVADRDGAAASRVAAVGPFRRPGGAAKPALSALIKPSARVDHMRPRMLGHRASLLAMRNPRSAAPTGALPTLRGSQPAGGASAKGGVLDGWTASAKSQPQCA